MTKSLDYAISETNRRRELQKIHNEANGITPVSIRKNIVDSINNTYEQDYVTVDTGISKKTHLVGHNITSVLKDLNKNMHAAAADLEFEEAARLRDEIRRLEATELGLNRPGISPKVAWKHKKKKKIR